MADERRVRRLLADRAAVLTELLRDEDADRAERVTEVMLQMQTLDIATLEEADAGQLWWPS